MNLLNLFKRLVDSNIKMSDIDSSDSLGSYNVEDEPMFNVLSQFLVSNDDKNIASVLSDICEQLKELNKGLHELRERLPVSKA